jgi:hypothetical protein
LGLGANCHRVFLVLGLSFVLSKTKKTRLLPIYQKTKKTRKTKVFFVSISNSQPVTLNGHISAKKELCFGGSRLPFDLFLAEKGLLINMQKQRESIEKK